LLRKHLVAVLLALGMAANCFAQSASSQSPVLGTIDPALKRHIANMVRSQFSVPQEVDLAVGERKPSPMAGYDAVGISFSHGEQKTTIDFLLSKDNQTLARLEGFSLAKDPFLSISLAGRPIRGNPGAKVTVIDFDDLECPVCSRVHHALFPGTLERYKDKVRFIHKDNPLAELHPWATHAAVDANCLAALSNPAYWGFVDYVHSHAEVVSGENRDLVRSSGILDRIAREQGKAAGADTGKMEACLLRNDEGQVSDSLKDARLLGLNFAPALFVNGERISGYIPDEELWRVIDRALRDAGEEPPSPPASVAGPAQHSAGAR